MIEHTEEGVAMPPKTTKKRAASKKGKGGNRSSKRSAKPSMEDLKNFIRTRGAEYLKDPNISSVGVGYKMKEGKRTEEIAIQFTVKEKASSPEALDRLGTVQV